MTADPLQQIRELIDSLPPTRNRLVAVVLAEDLYDAVRAHCKNHFEVEPFNKSEPAGPAFRFDGIDLRKEKYLQPGHYMPLYQRADGSQTWDQDDTRTVSDCIWPVEYQGKFSPREYESENAARRRERRERIRAAHPATPDPFPTDVSIVDLIKKETEK